MDAFTIRNKKIKTLVLGIGVVPVVIGVLVMTGLNFYQYHNVSYETEDKKVFQKADGVFGHTQLTLDHDGSIKIDRFIFFGTSKYYTDNDGDQKVDRIQEIQGLFARGGHSVVFSRDKHLEKYPLKFKNADRDFKEQIRRFKPYISR